MSLVLFVSAVAISAIIAVNERAMLERSLMTKGQSLAANIAKRNENALTIKGSTRLDSVQSDLSTDEETVYTLIENEKGDILTTQFESINYRWPGLKSILPTLARDIDLKDMVRAIKSRATVREVTVPIVVGSDTFGRVVIGMSDHKIRKQIASSVVFAFSLSLIAALVLGAVLFVASEKAVFNPLIELGQAATRLAKGDLGTRIEIRAIGEVRLLVDSFNRMAEDLQRTTISSATLKKIFDSMPYGIVMIDRDKIIVNANRAALTLMGYESEEQVAGRSCRDTFCPAEGRACPVVDLGGTVDHAERILVKKDGRRIPILESIVPLALGGRDVLLEAFADISDLKKAEEELRIFSERLKRSNRELEDFAHIASHDLQEPLRKVRAFGDRLRANLGDKLDDQASDYLQRMQNAATRMQVFISDLLSFSRVSTKAQPFTSVDLAGTVREVAADMETRLEETGGRLDVGALPVVEADPLQMRQLLQNLIGNALKFHKDGEPPVVKVSGGIVRGSNGNALPEGDCVELVVEDNGIGFDEKYADRIFGVFQRLHGRSQYEGTGIGLSICQKIVERHGGVIRVKSSPGQGAAFTVTLPRTSPKPERVAGPATARAEVCREG